MKLANRLVTVFFCTVLFILAVFSGGLMFTRKLDDPSTMQKVVTNLELSDLLEDMNVNPSLKNALGHVVDSVEFKDIMTTYASGFVDYLMDGETNIKVTQKQVELLLNNHKDELLNSIPGGQYIPADLIQSFLLDYVNIDDVLPKYSDLSSEVPVEVIRILRLTSSNALLGCVFCLMIGCMGMIMMVKKNMRNSLKPIAISFYLASLCLFMIPYLLEMLDIFKSIAHANIDQTLYLLLADFKIIALMNLMIALIIHLMSILLKRKKVGR